MERRCLVCGEVVDLNLSPETNLKNILNLLYSKGKADLASTLGKKVLEELEMLKKNYNVSFTYSDGVMNPPLCKKCFIKIIESSIEKKNRSIIGEIKKIIA